jgi:hypothetical protein
MMLLVGVALGLVGIAAAAAHRQYGQAAVYSIVAVMLSAVTLLVAKDVRWAVLLCVVALGGQPVAVVGCIWELTHGVDAVKADPLRAIGFDPVFAVTVNLVYSTVGFAVFCWIVSRGRTRRGPGRDVAR